MILDLETLGTEPGCVILQVGAIGDNGRSVEYTVDIEDAVAQGLTIDPDGVRWWLKKPQSPQLYDAPEVPLAVALEAVCALWQRDELVWCRGPDFDIPILEAAAAACGVRIPWRFWQARDIRTIQDLVGRHEDEADHLALADCRRDLVLVERWKRLCQDREEHRRMMAAVQESSDG